MNPSSLRQLFSNNQQSLLNSDLVLLIDEINYPALLFDPQSRLILCGNSQFVEISGMGNPELMHIKLDQLLSGNNDALKIENRLYSMQLRTKTGRSVPVHCQFKTIAKHGRIALLKLSHISDSSKQAIDLILLDGIASVYEIALTGDVKHVIGAVYNWSSEIFDNLPQEIYLEIDGELIKQSGSNAFPEKLPLSEMDRINEVDVWFPGKRILSESQRVGRKLDVSALLTIPIKSNNISGLLITGMKSKQFYTENQQEIETFIKWVNLLLDLVYQVSKYEAEAGFRFNQISLFQRLIENANDLFLILNSNNKIIFANQPFLEKLGYSSYELLEKKIFDFIDDQKLVGVISKSNENPNDEIESLTVYDRSGKKYLMKCIVEQIVYGHEVRRLIILSDKTHVSHLESSISRLEKQGSLGESIADFAHDARNPLNNISTGLQMLRKVYADNRNLVEAVDRMQSDCIRMSDLLESVLSYSRQNIEDFTRIDLESLILNIFKKFENKFAKENIHSVFTSKLPAVFIYGDIRSLERVFINLINNSIESMEGKGGELAILIKSNPNSQDEIEISIADTGTGIPQEILEKAFEPYVTGKKTGTGLGMAIIKKIIDAHQGRITIESYTSGTIFRIFLNRFKEKTS